MGASATRPRAANSGAACRSASCGVRVGFALRLRSSSRIWLAFLVHALHQREARRDAEQRSAILDGLRAKLAQGDKALVGNSGFRRYLKTVSAEHFAVQERRVAEDARFDGLYVLRTNT